MFMGLELQLTAGYPGVEKQESNELSEFTTYTAPCPMFLGWTISLRCSGVEPASPGASQRWF